MTTTAEAIVTALGEGPSTARDLSQRLDGISYANARQVLSRLAAAGIVTKVRRGLYAIEGDASDCDSGAPEADAPARLPAPYVTSDVAGALADLRADFEAMNDPRDPRAWA